MDLPNEALLTLVSKIDVMKPNSIKDKDLKQVAKLEALFSSDEYAAEKKEDGCHYLMVGCRFFSTEHIEKTDNYPHLRDFFIKLDFPNLILDGEIFYPGKTSQYCTRVTGADASTAVAFQQKNGQIHYYFWDMLRTPKGTWLNNVPYIKRREILVYFYDQFIKNTSMAEFIHLSDMRIENKKEFVDKIIADGGEGAVLKKLNSLYVMGKKPAWMWMKYKIKDTADFFITGYEAPTIKYSGTDFDNWPYWRDVNGVMTPVSQNYYYDLIGAIELSAYVNGQETKICTCSGIDDNLRKEISENREGFMGKVVKISFMQCTEAGYPRHPRFEEFHESKTADECMWELSK